MSAGARAPGILLETKVDIDPRTGRHYLATELAQAGLVAGTQHLVDPDSCRGATPPDGPIAIIVSTDRAGSQPQPELCPEAFPLQLIATGT